ncbi:putative helicase A859L [Labeo rohita]|uniref:Helicase A859L n=1 Tax=Labeo rohita TaxID=84645 RepID=A0ABQ8L632_LABRO|nr:putative helicase A859L [Labeo rohita]
MPIKFLPLDRYLHICLCVTSYVPGIDFKAALFMLPALFREKLEHFIELGESEPSSPYPTVQVQETTDWKTVITRRVTAVIRVNGIERCG